MARVNAHGLYELARRQGGVFARWQAVELGFSYYAIARRIEAKEWVHVLGGVLSAASTALGPLSMEWAAYLGCGPNSVLSGPSALRRHRVDVDAGAAGMYWVTIPPERHVQLRSVRTIRESVPLADIVVVEGMRVTSVARSIVDTLRVVPERIGQPILDRALLRGWLTMEELQARTLAFAGRRGVTRLRCHYDRVRAGARSEAERRLHEIIADVPGWVADYKVSDDRGAVVAAADVAFAKRRIAVEIDGLAFHTDPVQYQRDRTRQNRLVGLGWRVLRYTWDDLTRRPDRVKQEIVAELAKQDPAPR